jgi:hypothetical protein
MSTIRATYVQHGSSAVPNITLNASGQVIVASGIVSSGTFAAPTGSAAAPGVYFVGDTNTGLYSPGADQVAVATNGTGRLFVDSSGRVGVGTGGSAIQSTLHVSKNGAEGFEFIPGDSANTNVVIHYNRSGTTWVTNEQWADSHIFRTQSTERLRITSAGLVGIGTSSPSSRLHVSGSEGTLVNIQGTSASAYLLLGNSNNNLGYIGYEGTNFNFYPNNTANALVVTPTGVGIGTTNPSFRLHSYDATAAQGFFNGWSSGGTFDAAGAIRFGNQTSYQGRIDFDPSGNTNFIFENSYLNGAISWKINGGEKARLTPSGQLLVGTSSARATWAFSTDGSLQVERSNYAAMQVVGNANTTSGAYLSFLKSRGGAIGGTTIVQNNDELGWISFEGMDGANPKAGAAIVAFVDGTPGANDMPGRLVFSTTADGASTPTERMRIGRNGFTKCAGNSTLHDASGLYHEFISNTDVSGPIIFCRQRAGAGSQRGIDVYYDAVLNSANNAFFISPLH